MKKYLEMAKNEWKLQFQYRINALLSSSWVIVSVVIYYFLWRFIYERGGRMGDYRLSSLITYYIITSLLGIAMPVFAYYSMTWDIKDGGLPHFLIKPFRYLLYYYAVVTGGTLFWFLLNLVVLMPFMFLWRGNLHSITLSGFLMGCVFCIIGYHIAILCGFILNLLSFFIGDPYGMSGVYDFFIMFTGGAFIPLDLMPAFLKFLPFRYVYFIPARAFLGLPMDIIGEFITGVLWIILLSVIVYVLWTNGLKRYESFGG